MGATLEKSTNSGFGDVTAIVVLMTDKEKPFARDAICSVFSQTIRPSCVKVYVAESNAWIDEIASEFPHVEIQRISLAPLGEVRNIGVRASATEWVAFLDGDDVWEPAKIEKQFFALNSETPFVATDYYIANERGDVCAVALSRVIPAPSTWFVRRKYMLEHPFENIPNEDSEWWTKHRVWEVAVRVSQPLMRYRVREGSIMGSSERIAPSRRRKMLIVRMGQVPILRNFVFCVTWLLHFVNRRDCYTAPSGG